MAFVTQACSPVGGSPGQLSGDSDSGGQVWSPPRETDLTTTPGRRPDSTAPRAFHHSWIIEASEQLELSPTGSHRIRGIYDCDDSSIAIHSRPTCTGSLRTLPPQ